MTKCHGRIQNLQREVDLNANALSKTSSTHQYINEQNKIATERIQQLESDYEQMREQRNESREESNRLNQQINILEKNLQQYQVASMKT